MITDDLDSDETKRAKLKDINEKLEDLLEKRLNKGLLREDAYKEIENNIIPAIKRIFGIKEKKNHQLNG